MGAGAISKLPERLDRALVKQLVPDEFYDESIFVRHASADGTISREILQHRAVAMEKLSEAARRQKEGASASHVMTLLEQASAADPDFLMARKAYAQALASSGELEKAITLMQSEDCGKPDQGDVMHLLVNVGVEHINEGDYEGTLKIFERADALGTLPAEAQALVYTAKYHKLREVIQIDPETAANSLAKLREDVSRMDQSAVEIGFHSEGMLRRIIASEGLATGFLEMKNGFAAAAGARFEDAADHGEPNARSLAAESYLKAALDEFKAFAATRGMSEASPERPPQLVRALSDQGHGQLCACATTAILAQDTAAAARADLLSLAATDAAAIVPALERLAQIEDIAKQLLGRIKEAQEMVQKIHRKEAGPPEIEVEAGNDSDDKPQVSVPLPTFEKQAAASNYSTWQNISASSSSNPAAFGHQPGVGRTILCFKESDCTNDGFISRNELATVLRNLCGKAMNDAQIASLLRPFALEGDDRINYVEFIAWLNGETPPEDPDLREIWKLSRESLHVLESLVSGAKPKQMQSDVDSKVASAQAAIDEAILGAKQAMKNIDAFEGRLQEHYDKLCGGVSSLNKTSVAPGESSAIGGSGDDADPWHGHEGSGKDWASPTTVAASDAEARPGYWAYDATEYLDTKDVLREKVKVLAAMLRESKDCVVYSGAGLSTAAGIGDYASKAKGSVAVSRPEAKESRLELRPTIAHHALAALCAKGHIKHAINQNHDRLFQKAGFPQAKINEIHGAWGDNKNTVKMMDDVLRKDLLDWLEAWIDRADMCIAIGTSLCGMNADRVVQAVCSRYPANGKGLVIIGLQRSVYDASASLRIWGLCDDVMAMVCKELGIPCPDGKIKKAGDNWDRTHPRLKFNTPKRTAKDPM